MSRVYMISREATPYKDGPNLAPGWVAETIAIWTQFPARKGILDLTDRNIAELPVEIYRMRNLEQLIINKNMIGVLPKELEKLAEAQALKSIECNYNLLVSIDDISALQSLEILEFSNNLLQTFPTCLGALYNLTKLDLSCNQIQEIPGCIGNLIFLNYLNISQNQIKMLPQTLMNLTNLNTLDISQNRIEKISPAIANLTRLEKFHLNDNKIDILPIELGFLINIERIDFHNNPFSEQPEIHVNEIDTKPKLFNFLRTQIREKEETRKLLFDERDNKKNNCFEVIEGETKPTLVGVTPEKLIVFLTQVSSPDPQILSCLALCYSYFITPDDIITLFYYRIQMNNNTKAKKEQKRVEEIIRGR